MDKKKIDEFYYFHDVDEVAHLLWESNEADFLEWEDAVQEAYRAMARAAIIYFELMCQEARQ